MVTAGLKWPPEMWPKAYALAQDGKPRRQGHSEEPDAQLHLLVVEEEGGQHCRAADAEDQPKGAEELRSEAGAKGWFAHEKYSLTRGCCAGV